MSRLLQDLGFAAESRAVILHVDDVGMCHGANVAYLELFQVNAVTAGSVMVPGPWFAEIAREAQRHRWLDLGVHLTLTSEWEGYRWRAISTCSLASGLVDEDGYLPRNCRRLKARLVPEAAEIEMHAQIESALNNGIDVTHIDSHMGAAMLPELLPSYLKLGRKYRLPILLPRDIRWYLDRLRLEVPDLEPYRLAVKAELLAPDGLPVVDSFRVTPGVPTDQVEQVYRHLLMTLPKGVTFMSLHCNVPGDIEAITPQRAHSRTDEYELFKDGRAGQWMGVAKVAGVGFRAIRDVWRDRLKRSQGD